jgi:hypothetical protein
MQQVIDVAARYSYMIIPVAVMSGMNAEIVKKTTDVAKAIDELAPGSGIKRDATANAVQKYNDLMSDGKPIEAALSFVLFIRGAVLASTGLSNDEKDKRLAALDALDIRLTAIQHTGETKDTKLPSLSMLTEIGGNNGDIARLLALALSPSVGLNGANAMANWALALRELDVTSNMSLDDAIKYASSKNPAEGCLAVLNQLPAEIKARGEVQALIATLKKNSEAFTRLQAAEKRLEDASFRVSLGMKSDIKDMTAAAKSRFHIKAAVNLAVPGIVKWFAQKRFNASQNGAMKMQNVSKIAGAMGISVPAVLALISRNAI